MPIGTLDDIPLDQAVLYSVRDSDATLRLYPLLSSQLSSHNPSLSPLMSIGMYVLPIFEEIQSTGMPASRSYFSSLSSSMWEEMKTIQRQLSECYYSSKPFNPGSPKHTSSLLRRRGLESEKRTPTGEMSTSKPSIEHLRYSDPAFSLLFDWRERQHVKDSFCKPVLERIPEDYPDDIYPIRCQIKVTRTATRRPASTNPNLLAIPSRNDLGRRVRSGYQCPEGEVFGAWDFSQIEARVMAHESRDTLLCEFFHDGKDIHAETAAVIFNLPLDSISKDQRRAAKIINFGIIYGLQALGLQTQLRVLGILWEIGRCEKMIDSVLGLYSGIRRYIRQTSRGLADPEKGNGVVHDHWGMPRYLPGIWSQDPKVSAEAGRIAVSHKIQGMAQGMLYNSMAYLRPIIRNLQEEGLNVKWSLQVHDELIFRFAEDLWDIMNDLVINALVNHCGIRLRVPVLAEGHCARSWGELKD